MKNSSTPVDPNAQLGRDVMKYLGDFSAKSKRKRKVTTELKSSPLKNNSALFAWHERGTEADSAPAPKTSKISEPRLRVSNLLSKMSSNDNKDPDYITDSVGAKRPVNKPLAEGIRSWQNTFKSPIFASLTLGAIPAAAFWGIHKFVNPDEEGTEGQTIEIAAGKLIEEDEKAGVPLKDRQYYIDRAIENQRKDRWKTTLAIGLGSAALAHLWNVNPSDWSQLYKYPKVRGVNKTASMLGPVNAVDYNTLQSLIAFNPDMAPTIKQSALNALSYDPKPIMTSTNIVNNAIYSGESAKTGLPIGRIITSAAVDGLAGYGLGKLLGVGSPKRVGLLSAIGSALHNALS